MKKNIYKTLDKMKIEFESERKNFIDKYDLDFSVYSEALNILSKLYTQNKLIIHKKLTSVYGCMVAIAALKRNNVDISKIDFIVE